MKKVYQISMMIIAALVFAACGNKPAQEGENAEGTSTEQTAEVADEVKEGSAGPCTVSCDKFSIDIPEGWVVRVINENEISAGKEYKEGVSFVYDEQANYKQSQQIKMEISGMEDRGEKTLGDNTYATFLCRDNSGDSYSAILKIGDGENGIIKLNTTNVKTDDNEIVLKVMESLKMK